MNKTSKQIIIGSILTLTCSLLYILMGVIAKSLDTRLSLGIIIFLQSVAGLVCAILFIKNTYSFTEIIKQQQPSHLSRSIFSLASTLTFIYGLKFVSIFNALVIMNTSPLLMPFLRKALIGKSIQNTPYVAILIALAGIIFILKPDETIFDYHILIIGISMITMAASLIIIEKNNHIDPLLSIFYYFFYSFIFSAIYILIHFKSFFATTSDLCLGLLAGIIFFFVQVSVVYAANLISSTLISILFYAEVIMGLIISIIQHEAKPTLIILTGVIMVISGGLISIYSENKLQSLK